MAPADNGPEWVAAQLCPWCSLEQILLEICLFSIVVFLFLIKASRGVLSFVCFWFLECRRLSCRLCCCCCCGCFAVLLLRGSLFGICWFNYTLALSASGSLFHANLTISLGGRSACSYLSCSYSVCSCMRNWIFCIWSSFGIISVLSVIWVTFDFRTIFQLDGIRSSYFLGQHLLVTYVSDNFFIVNIYVGISLAFSGFSGVVVSRRSVYFVLYWYFAWIFHWVRLPVLHPVLHSLLVLLSLRFLASSASSLHFSSSVSVSWPLHFIGGLSRGAEFRGRAGIWGKFCRCTRSVFGDIFLEVLMFMVELVWLYRPRFAFTSVGFSHVVRPKFLCAQRPLHVFIFICACSNYSNARHIPLGRFASPIGTIVHFHVLHMAKLHNSCSRHWRFASKSTLTTPHDRFFTIGLSFKPFMFFLFMCSSCCRITVP